MVVTEKNCILILAYALLSVFLKMILLDQGCVDGTNKEVHRRRRRAAILLSSSRGTGLQPGWPGSRAMDNVIKYAASLQTTDRTRLCCAGICYCDCSAPTLF